MFSPVKEKGSSSVKVKGSSPVKDTSRLPRATLAAGRPLSPQQNPREKPYVAAEESQERCPKKPVVKLHAPSDLRHRLQARRFATNTATTCLVIAGQVLVSPRLAVGGKMRAEKQLAIERRQGEVEAELSSSRRRLSLMEWLRIGAQQMATGTAAGSAPPEASRRG